MTVTASVSMVKKAEESKKFPARADVLIGTLGKAFGSDGGYVVGSEALVAYSHESTATYSYSNPITPASAAALVGLALINSAEGTLLRQQIQQNIQNFQAQVLQTPYHLAKQSDHPIQPLLIGENTLAAKLTEQLFTHQILVTNINYPVVPVAPMSCVFNSMRIIHLRT